MVITQYVFHTQPGKTEEARRLYQEWQLLLYQWRPVSTKLLVDPHDPAEMLLEVRFDDEETAWAAAESPPHCTWYACLVALADAGPMVDQYFKIESE